jgi:hypothetical protein
MFEPSNAQQATRRTHSPDAAPPHLPPQPSSVVRTRSRKLRRRLLVLLAVYVPCYLLYFSSSAFFSLPSAAAACGGRPVLDVRWSYSAQAAQDYLTACGPVGRMTIEHQQLADLFYPALLAAVLLAAFTYLLHIANLTGPRWPVVLVLPLITAGLDYLENAGVWIMLTSYPRTEAIASQLSLLTEAKLSTGYLSVAALAVLAVTATVRRLRAVRSVPEMPAA